MSVSLKEKIRPWIIIQRPFNCFLITMCAIVGIMVSNPHEFNNAQLLSHLPSLIMIFIGGWALSASAMVLNDYFDIEVDKINDPNRPIPSGKITPKQALTFGIILIVIGILMGIGIDLYEFFYGSGAQIGVSIVTSVVCAIMAAAYTKYMKRFSIIGNLAVSVGVWVGFLYGDLVLDFRISILTQCMAAAAFFLNFGREVSKGIMDVEGDRENNVTTVATALGPKWTAIISSVIMFLAIPVSIIPIFIAEASWAYLFSINVIQALVLAVSIWLLIDSRPETIKKIKYMVLVTMLLALIAFSLEAFLGLIISPVIP